jgi:lipoprotein-anchoring transpeptidase ErfK/SrfK
VRVTIAIALAAVFAAVPATASASTLVRLSDERTSSQTAYVHRAVAVRSAPHSGAAVVGRLRTTTYYGIQERVLVLARDTRRPGWLKVRYPGFGTRSGWVPEESLSGLQRLTTQLVIDRRRLEARLYRSGRLAWRAPVGVGAAGSPTPPGRYYVRERLVPARPGGVYGVLAFGTSAYSHHRTSWAGGGQVGIHGTNQPGLIPGRISNGCIRLRDRSIRRLDRLMPLGTPLRIL